MICFLCSFTSSSYCYCRPSRPVSVVSTTDMLLIDFSPPDRRPPICLPRRTASEPPQGITRDNFVRFRSLRETKRRQCIRPRRPLVPNISLASSTDFRIHRKKLRSSGRRNRKIRTPSTSCSSSISDYHIMSSTSNRVIPPYELDLPSLQLPIDHSANVSSTDSTEHQPTDIIGSHSPSQMARLMRPNGSRREMLEAEERIEKEIERMRECLKEIRDSQSDLAADSSLVDDTLPEGWEKSINYAEQMKQFVQSCPTLNQIVCDSLDEEDRRSRTEMWVESTSPGLPDSDDEVVPDVPSELVSTANEITRQPLIPQVTVDHCSDNSEMSGKLAESQEERKPAIRLNGELLEDIRKEAAAGLERMDSLQTDEPTSETSMISSDMDKKSLIKIRYHDNLSKARENSEAEVNLEEVDRFWHYRYSPDMRDSEAAELNRSRGHTPTVERVVLYYTSHKRPSMTPSLSPSPSVFSPSPDPSSRHQSFLLSTDICQEPRSPPVPMSHRPSLLPTSESLESKEEIELKVDSPRDSVADCLEDSERLQKISEIPESSSSDSIIVGTIEPDAPLEGNSFFHLDTISQSEEEGEDGHVVHYPGFDSPPRFISRSTCTSPVASSYVVGGAVGGLSHHIPIRGAEDSSLVHRDSSMPEELNIVSSSFPSYHRNTTHTMTNDHSDTSLTCHKSWGHLEESSVEDLLAIETRPNSTGRKSVTFSDYIDEEIASPEIRRKLHLHCSRSATITKPILKKEDKTTESMRKVLEYAGGRLSKDLRMLVEERDRATHALQVTPACTVELSPQTAAYQTRYRNKLEENKCALDKRIDEVWLKLRDLPLDSTQASFVYSVHDSSHLTVNGRRRILPRRNTTIFQIEKKGRTELELASEYARKLEKMRSMMVRRDSEMAMDNER